MEQHGTELAIRASGVRKRYPGADEKWALDSFDLGVPAGTVHGLLGPNGAGKTTAVRIMATLLDLDAGDIRVAGYDVASQGRQVRRRIGLVGQYAAVDEELSGLQNLVLFSRLNRLTAKAASRRAAELLEQFGLADTGARPISAYSGGMRRRLDLAAALIVAPQVLFVDEPTTGLDPAGRRDVWDAVHSMADGGTTVLLTTQYLEEADQLADHISMLASGRIVADGTPAQLKAQVGSDWIELVPRDEADGARVTSAVSLVASGEVRFTDGRIQVPVTDRASSLIEIARILSDAGIAMHDISVHTPTLDEVFLHLTGTTTTDQSVGSPA